MMVLSAFALSMAGEEEGEKGCDSVAITEIFQAPVIPHLDTSKWPLHQFTMQSYPEGQRQGKCHLNLGITMEKTMYALAEVNLLEA